MGVIVYKQSLTRHEVQGSNMMCISNPSLIAGLKFVKEWIATSALVTQGASELGGSRLNFFDIVTQI